jgi:predicted NACHT family NTPase
MVGPSARDLTTRKITYPWQRFWCARGGTIDLSDYGFMLDPESDFWALGRPKPLTLEQVSNYRALILLGEPGMGKSATLEQEVARLTQGIDQAVAAIKVDLRAFSSEDLLYRRVFESAEFQHWARGTSQLVLHLDSLDEALLRIDSIASLLADELPRHPTERLSIRITCRTAVWPVQTLEPALNHIWGEAAVGAFELAPLRRTDVMSAASLHGVDSADFISAVFEADVVPLAIKPLTLNMLLDIYERDAKPPLTSSPSHNNPLLVVGCYLKPCSPGFTSTSTSPMVPL